MICVLNRSNTILKKISILLFLSNQMMRLEGRTPTEVNPQVARGTRCGVALVKY